jgi:hypothetical protein
MSAFSDWRYSIAKRCIKKFQRTISSTPKNWGEIKFYFFLYLLLENQAKKAIGNRAELQFIIKDTKKYPLFKTPGSYSLL